MKIKSTCSECGRVISKRYDKTKCYPCYQRGKTLIFFSPPKPEDLQRILDRPHKVTYMNKKNSVVRLPPYFAGCKVKLVLVDE